MKFSKLFLILSILLIAGCDSDTSEEPATVQNIIPEITEKEISESPVERLAYTEETKRLLSGEYNTPSSFPETNIDEDAQIDIEPITPPVDPSLLSSYSTKILTDDKNRYNNIMIVSDKLNGFILQPGSGFSFNDELGPYGKDDGFLEAKILLSNGEESTGYGGGVCQLSTTLYNAVKDLDEIQITEHHNHSTPVAYAPKNQDATVSLQSGLDFKFINNYNFPIRFETQYDPDNLIVRIYRND